METTAERKASLYIGCSGRGYWKWRDSLYAEVPQSDWFKHYLKRFDTVEIIQLREIVVAIDARRRILLPY